MMCEYLHNEKSKQYLRKYKRKLGKGVLANGMRKTDDRERGEEQNAIGNVFVLG